MPSPFTPSFGVSPPVLVGRADLLEDFADALEAGPGAPGRATLYTGGRGTGKTVMLNEAEDLARQQGWRVIAEAATPGLVERLTNEHLPALLAGLDPGTSTTVTGVSAPMGLGSATWRTESAHSPDRGLRQQLTQTCDLLTTTGTGLLLTVDEVHRAQVDDLRQVATVIQHLFREGRDVAFAAAGLPAAVTSLLNDDVLTFLRRADRHVLGPVDPDDVAAAIADPIEHAGRHIDPADLHTAAEATGGYPFLIQLVGHHIWRQHPDEHTISNDDVRAGITAAQRRLGSLVHEPALADLSEVDRTFLLAMAHDDGPSALADIAERLGVDTNYAGQYRLRLIAAGLIEPAGRGRVDLSLPHLREHLRNHGAADA